MMSFLQNIKDFNKIEIKIGTILNDNVFDCNITDYESILKKIKKKQFPYKSEHFYFSSEVDKYHYVYNNKHYSYSYSFKNKKLDITPNVRIIVNYDTLLKNTKYNEKKCLNKIETEAIFFTINNYIQLIFSRNTFNKYYFTFECTSNEIEQLNIIQDYIEEFFS